VRLAVPRADGGGCPEPALAEVRDEESGLAAGLVDSSFNIGGALGIAILSTVAVTGADEALTRTGSDAPLQAITEGYQNAFAVAVGFAVVGLLMALTLLGRRKATAKTTVAIEADTD
jgi:hypothetical protein